MATEPVRQGLLIDFGGVLTTDLFASFAAWCERTGRPADAVRDQFRHPGPGQDLLIAFETGRLSEAQFEAGLAPLLGVDPDGLVPALMAGLQPDEAMFAAVAAAHDAGVRTGLISNSWGSSGYDFERFAEMFDALVISGDEGIRKPAPEIYVLGADRIGLAPEACVFVDDLGGNLKPAKALGMATVLHRTAARTVAELEPLLGIALAA